MDIAKIGKFIAGAGAVFIAVSVESPGDYKQILFSVGTLLVAIGTYIALHYVVKIKNGGLK